MAEQGKKVLIVGGGTIGMHLTSRGVTEPYRGVLVDSFNQITGQNDPIVKFHGSRGGPGFLCLSTIHYYGGNIVDVTD